MAESQNGNYTLALEAYRKFLLEAENEASPERIAEVEAEVERLQARVGKLRIKCDLEGAAVKVDNETKGETPLREPILVDVGKHEVVVKKGVTELFREAFRIAGGQEIVFEVADIRTREAAPAKAGPTGPVKTEPAAPEPLPRETAPPPSDNEEKPKRLWTWVAYGVGAAAAVGAAITGAQALSLESRIWDECDGDGTCYSDTYNGDFEDDTHRLRVLGITTDVLIGVAAIGVVAGTVLLFVEPRAQEKRSAASESEPTIGTSGFSIHGRF
jgi:hypothetical protein